MERVFCFVIRNYRSRLSFVRMANQIMRLIWMILWRFKDGITQSFSWKAKIVKRAILRVSNLAIHPECFLVKLQSQIIKIIDFG